MVGIQYSEKEYEDRLKIWKNRGVYTFSGVFPKWKVAKNKVFFMRGKQITYANRKNFKGKVLYVGKEKEIKQRTEEEIEVKGKKSYNEIIKRIKSGQTFKLKHRNQLETLLRILDADYRGIILTENMYYNEGIITYSEKKVEIDEEEITEALTIFRKKEYLIQEKIRRKIINNAIKDVHNADMIFKKGKKFYADKETVIKIEYIVQQRRRKEKNGYWKIDKMGNISEQKIKQEDIDRHIVKKIVDKVFKKEKERRMQ